MESSFGRLRQVRRAAGRSGYFPAEMRRLLREPAEMFQGSDEHRLHFSRAGIEAFMHALDGQPADARQLAEFGLQLYGVEDPDGSIRRQRKENQRMEGRYAERDGEVDDEERTDDPDTWDTPSSVRSPSASQTFHDVERADATLLFDDEQRVLLAKNLLEDAFFKGSLAHLNGGTAAALAFVVNRMGKLLDQKGKISEGIKEDFVFSRTRIEKLLRNVHDFVELTCNV